MNKFKFKRVKNKFRWESDFMVLEFSNPSIQGFSDYTNLKSEKNIMYYYYTVKIFKKIIEWDDKDNEIGKWRLVSKRNTSDFPSITQLKWILDHQLKDDTTIDGQRHEYTNGDVRYSKVFSTEGFACDDFYEITKNTDDNGKDIRYIVYAGTTYDCQGDLNSSGIRTPYVNTKDIEELLKCVSEFIQYSLDKHNECVGSLNDAFEIKNNKIYKYKILDNNKVIKDEVESIFAIGDILDITTVVDNKEDDYYDVGISEIADKDIILDNGYIIDLNSIVWINNNPTDGMLEYKENEIVREFISILSSEEREEFINCSTDFLLSKYKMAIIDRTWMCRDEHDFNMDYDKGDRVNKVIPIVKSVIDMIKLELNKTLKTRF